MRKKKQVVYRCQSILSPPISLCSIRLTSPTYRVGTRVVTWRPRVSLAVGQPVTWRPRVGCVRASAGQGLGARVLVRSVYAPQAREPPSPVCALCAGYAHMYHHCCGLITCCCCSCRCDLPVEFFLPVPHVRGDVVLYRPAPFPVAPYVWVAAYQSGSWIEYHFVKVADIYTTLQFLSTVTYYFHLGYFVSTAVRLLPRWVFLPYY